MTKYIDADKLRKLLTNRYEEITVPVLTDEGGLESFYCRSEIHNILKIVESLQQEQPSLPDNLDEAAEKYRRVSCNAAMKPNIDGPIPEYGGNVKTAFIAGAQWMKEQMMNDAVEGTLAGQLLSSLTENGKQMVITVPRNKFPSNPKTKNIKLIIVKEN